MQLPFTANQFRRFVAYIGGLASVVLGYLPIGNQPTSTRDVLISVGGLILAVEHYNSKPTTPPSSSTPTSAP